MSRIAIINSHPIQYFAPLYAAMNAEDDLKVSAYYMSDVSIRGELDSGFGQAVQWDVDLLRGYEAHFIKGATRRKPSGFFSVPGWDLWRELRRKKYDATLVHGYRYMANIVAVLASKSVRRPIFVRGEIRCCCAEPGSAQSSGQQRCPSSTASLTAFWPSDHSTLSSTDR